MYVRTTSRRTKDGSEVRYLQLAHNEWDADAGRSRPRILFSFGREDQLDRTGIERLIGALSRLLDPASAAALTAPADLAVTGSRPLGGTFILDALWRRLRIDAAVTTALAGRRLDAAATERVLFALVANRALAASSKLAATGWISNDVHIDGLAEVSDDACYRAMDALVDVDARVAEQVYFGVTDLLNLEVDLLFFDTTSTYFELDEPDEPVWRDEHGRVVDAGDPVAVRHAGFRSFGKSKDSRDDLPQVVIGMAVTRDGIPVRVWSWPGSTADSKLIRQVKNDMRAWSLSRIVWVADRGFSSSGNRRELMRGAGGYIIGEKLRSGSPEVQAALSRQGRYQHVRENLQVKEVNIGSDDRFVLCYNPEQAVRDAATRERMIAQLEQAIAGSDTLTGTERAKLEGVISTKPHLKRFLRTTPGGLLRIDKKKIAAEENLDGKYLLRCCDPNLSSEDIALGYKQLLEVERGWRDMKQIIDLRPIYHRLEERIRAHVLLCWLALLLIRVAENTSGQTWQRIRTEADRLHAVTFTGPAGTFRQTTELTKTQRDLFTALAIDPPKRVQAAIPAA
ncbi:IS1634 family transposase [Dactylosporangium sp. CA-092794]|uniref:IS1634 family transposase n=1 Tax=Dactylosporangium sp. CA-092794 TaxID=3239929 RepID=UPI003D8F747C